MNQGLYSLRLRLIGMGIPIINFRWSTDLHMFLKGDFYIHMYNGIFLNE